MQGEGTEQLTRLNVGGRWEEGEGRCGGRGRGT